MVVEIPLLLGCSFRSVEINPEPLSLYIHMKNPNKQNYRLQRKITVKDEVLLQAKTKR